MSAEKALLRMEEVAEKLGISRARAYAMAAAGELPSVRIGRSRRVPVRQLEVWIEERVLDASPTASPVDAADPRGSAQGRHPSPDENEG
jgi:excisionase family DNA binding protein